MTINIDAGSLIIAPPGIPDQRFKNSVMLMSHKFRGGTVGLCINRPTEYTVKDILIDTGITANLNFPMYWGGPMNQTTIWMLHSAEWKIEHTMEISKNWSITSNLAMFYHLADNDVPKYFRMMFGHASWAPGQLEAELRGLPPWNPNHSWLTASEQEPEWLFECPVEDLWDITAELSGHQAVDSWL